MLVGLNPISTLGLNLRNGLSEQNSEVTTGKEIVFYVDPPIGNSRSATVLAEV